MLIHPDLVADSRARAGHAGLGAKPPTAAVTATLVDKENRFTALLEDTGDVAEAGERLERILGGNDLVSINYLQRGMIAARAVCRIHVRDAGGNIVGYGTGFLIAPRTVMTNHHVLGSTSDVASAIAEFDYELDVEGNERVPVQFRLAVDPAPIIDQPLDFCIAAVAPRSVDGKRLIDDYGWLPLNPTPGKAFVGEYLTIIQHPGGDRKQVCVRENQLLKFDPNGDTLWYNTDTVAGSSGSPCFNNSWQVVALHHSGIPATDDQGHWLTTDGQLYDRTMDESRLKWIANEGIRISRICGYLQDQHAASPLAAGVLATPAPPAGPLAGPHESASATSSLMDGELRVTVPIQIAVRVGNASTPLGAASGTPLQPVPAKPVATAAPVAAVKPAIEAVVVNQDDYDLRGGYDPHFLEGHTVPLPVVKEKPLKAQIAQVEGSHTGELKYWNYTVVMNKARRLAFFSAVNVDASLRPKNAGRDGDRWYVDTRLDAKCQVTQQFYGGQSTFEIDRTKNPFDRGHLTRRLDAQWGESAALASRNGNDSFHFTNCSPQHWKLNQGTKQWLGLEDYVITTFAHGKRACVINGPVFDAPESIPGPRGRIVPQIKGKRVKDPVFGDVAIPKLFFKIVACLRDNDTLAAAAFLMSQEEFLKEIGPRLHAEEILTTAEARMYQVQIADIETLTGLDFGSLSDDDTSGAPEAFRPDQPHPLPDLSHIFLQ